MFFGYPFGSVQLWHGVILWGTLVLAGGYPGVGSHSSGFKRIFLMVAALAPLPQLLLLLPLLALAACKNATSLSVVVRIRLYPAHANSHQVSNGYVDKHVRVCVRVRVSVHALLCTWVRACLQACLLARALTL